MKCYSRIVIKSFFLYLMTAYEVYSQPPLFDYSDTLNTKRRNAIIGAETFGAVSSLVLLNEIWYKNHARAPFHVFDDNAEWLQMDKAGHMMTSYYLGLAGCEMLKWSGVTTKKSAIYGGALGLFYLSGVELLDATSAQWGFSWGDMAANALGTGVVIGQELIWQEQKIKLKVSTHYSPYASIRPEVLGKNFGERLLKDYNGQTYWLSGNIHSLFLKESSKFPRWINFAIGYGAEEMITGTPDAEYCQTHPICNDYDRYRQYYLSLDIDLTKVHWKKQWLRTLFGSFGFIKIPFPAVEFSNQGSKMRWLYF